MAKTNNKRLYVMLGFLGILILYLILSRTVFAKKDKVKSPAVNTANNISFIVPETVSNNRKMVINKINNNWIIVNRIITINIYSIGKFSKTVKRIRKNFINPRVGLKIPDNLALFMQIKILE